MTSLQQNKRLTQYHTSPTQNKQNTKQEPKNKKNQNKNKKTNQILFEQKLRIEYNTHVTASFFIKKCPLFFSETNQ